MKLLFFTLVLTLSFSINAKVIVKSDDSNSDVSSLPQDFLSVFVDNGIKQNEISQKVFELSVENIRCDITRRDALYPDYSNAGLTTIKCYSNAQSDRFGKGTLLNDGRFLLSLINSVEFHRNVNFSDCSMGGKCVSFVNKIKCTVDLNKELMSEAYSCELE